jgi:chromate reductase
MSVGSTAPRPAVAPRWASRPYGDAVLTGKPVAVVGASPSPDGAAGAQAELRKVLGRAGARVLDGELGVGHAHEAFDPNGQLRDSALERDLADLLDDLQRALGLVAEAA